MTSKDREIERLLGKPMSDQHLCSQEDFLYPHTMKKDTVVSNELRLESLDMVEA